MLIISTTYRVSNLSLQHVFLWEQRNLIITTKMYYWHLQSYVDQYSMDTPVDVCLTLDQHLYWQSVESHLISDWSWVSQHGWLCNDCWSSVNQVVHWMSMDVLMTMYWSGCWSVDWDVEWGLIVDINWHSTAGAFV